jgi:hypothetical protein
MQARVSVFSSTTIPLLTLDTANVGLAGVIRDTDGTINVGPVVCTEENNSGGTFEPPVNIAATATLDGTQTNITVDAAGAAFNLTLPPVGASKGQFFRIARKNTANNVTVKGSGAEVIVSNGQSANAYVLYVPGQQVFLWCDGVQWYAMNNAAGAQINPPINCTGAATLDGTHTNVTVDGAGGAFTLTLPAAASSNGLTFRIARKATANNVTIQANGAEVILSSGASANTFVLAAQGQQVILWCDGVQWYSK